MALDVSRQDRRAHGAPRRRWARRSSTALMVQPFLFGGPSAPASASVREQILRRSPRRRVSLAALAGLAVAGWACSLACASGSSQNDNDSAARLSIAGPNFVLGGTDRWL